jgi:hypothetical protein
MSDFFSGYRHDLEYIEREHTMATSSPYPDLLMRGDWQTAPDIMDWWHIRDQSRMNSCRGHSYAASFRLGYYLQHGLPDLDGDGVKNEHLQDDFSSMYGYLMCQRQTRGLFGVDGGATIGSGIKANEQGGCARELVMPYPNPVRYSTNIPQAASQDGVNYQMQRHHRFEPGEAEKLFDWVGSNQGAIDWGTVWPLPFHKGCLVRGLSRGARGGGHATCGVALIRGEDLHRFTAQNSNRVPRITEADVKADEWLLAVANSHGEHAQWNGWYFCTMNAVEEILEHGFSEALGWSDLATPKPRKVDWKNERVLG